MQVSTGGRFKHPCRHFHRSVIALILNAAPTDRMSAFGYRFVHCDKPTEPRMPRVPDFSRLSIVGVALSSCITSGVDTRRSVKSVRQNSKNARAYGVWILWKTAKNAVSHRIHTHHLFFQEKNDKGTAISLRQSSTESDHGHRWMWSGS